MYIKDEKTGKEYIYIIGGMNVTLNDPPPEAGLIFRLNLDDCSMMCERTSGDRPSCDGSSFTGLGG